MSGDDQHNVDLILIGLFCSAAINIYRPRLIGQPSFAGEGNASPSFPYFHNLLVISESKFVLHEDLKATVYLCLSPKFVDPRSE